MELPEWTSTFDWMAWNWFSLLFFTGIGSALLVLIILAQRYPETDRYGVLGIPTTRGDRFFISLLGSAFIHLGWIGFLGGDNLYGASILSLLYAATVFRWV